ncbi:MAG: hypothetical protein LBG07_08420, partial [Treponema sp.]|nr:hypothetical protein [Treponema sp.]
MISVKLISVALNNSNTKPGVSNKFFKKPGGNMEKRISFLFIIICLGCMYVAAQDKPAWVDKPSIVYPERLYVSVVGYGRDRREAETGALGALSAY